MSTLPADCDWRHQFITVSNSNKHHSLPTGESGLGKTTLVNSIFLTNLYPNRKVPDAAGRSGDSICVVFGFTAVSQIQFHYPYNTLLKFYIVIMQLDK